MLNTLAKYSQQLVIPVGLLYNYPTSVNITMYEDTLTICAGLSTNVL